MNRIVREHYPVAALPEDLREGLPADADIRVTVETVSKDEAPERTPLEELFAMGRPSFTGADEAVDYIRAIRGGP